MFCGDNTEPHQAITKLLKALALDIIVPFTVGSGQTILDDFVTAIYKIDQQYPATICDITMACKYIGVAISCAGIQTPVALASRQTFFVCC